MKEHIDTALEKTFRASRQLVALEEDQTNQILRKLADLTLKRTGDILEANQKDLERMDTADPKYDRLLLSEERLRAIADDIRMVAELPSPLHRVLEQRTLPNGLELSKISVPLGVIGIVYESRPNVTFDVFSLCLKSGNASVLKGSRDAHDSNLAIAGVIREVLSGYGLEDVVYLAPSERAALPHILQADQYISTIIPRGGQGLIDFVRANSRVPVIETGAGICHTYLDASADPEISRQVITNAKARRVSVCNAMDTLVVHRDKLTHLPELLKDLGQQHRCTIFADESAYQQLADHYPGELLHPANAQHFGTEFLSMKLSLKTVDNLDQALEHIAQYSSRHSEAVLAEDDEVVDQFMRRVDAAVVYANTSTAFTDGAQFGLGAEIGISTQKLHARGPMGLQELTSYKWQVRGQGQIRP